jgi:hypothetical protein
MPPEEEKEKKQGVWGKYRNLVIIGAVVVVVVLIGFGIKANSTSGESVTLTSLSNQLQNVQATLINQAMTIGKIPITDSVADVSGIQTSMVAIMATLESMQGQWENLTANVSALNMTAQLDSIEEALANLMGNVTAINMTALNTTVWENHLMLVALCEALNITGVP